MRAIELWCRYSAFTGRIVVNLILLLPVQSVIGLTGEHIRNSFVPVSNLPLRRQCEQHLPVVLTAGKLVVLKLFAFSNLWPGSVLNRLFGRVPNPPLAYNITGSISNFPGSRIKMVSSSHFPVVTSGRILLNPLG